MRSLLAIGILAFAMTFCGLGDKLKGLRSGGTGSSNSNSASSSTSSSDSSGEKPTLTAAQQSIADSAVDVKWDEQGIVFRLPSSWKEQQHLKESFNYGSPDNAFLIASISVMSDSFPADISIKATYDSALEQLKQGKYEKVRWLEIDGVKGVEWWEAMPEIKDGARRHQWIAFRKYLGQNQQLNIMLSTKGTNFDKHRDDFAAIMYTMKIPKG